MALAREQVDVFAVDIDVIETRTIVAEKPAVNASPLIFVSLHQNAA